MTVQTTSSTGIVVVVNRSAGVAYRSLYPVFEAGAGRTAPDTQAVTIGNRHAIVLQCIPLPAPNGRGIRYPFVPVFKTGVVQHIR